MAASLTATVPSDPPEDRATRSKESHSGIGGAAGRAGGDALSGSTFAETADTDKGQDDTADCFLQAQ